MKNETSGLCYNLQVYICPYLGSNVCIYEHLTVQVQNKAYFLCKLRAFLTAKKVAEKIWGI